MSTKKFPYSSNKVTNHLKISLLEAAIEHMCSVSFSSGVKKPSLQELTLPLQVLLGENNDLVERLGIAESNVEKLSREVTVERLEKEIMADAIKKMVKEHKVTVNKMAEE
ncbi:hypothetical protein PVK06_043345 [Gossypium arboreum]|uniref:Uncharacterized protein n=1 Tax=Gossypium arboreum TaxID=29729 RepID=A0ABR0MNL3_GOSAR|nr:hypothetical protein PVK06_043345 [Gossypium arboreum]